VASLHDELFSGPLVIPSFNYYHAHYPPFDRMKRFPGRHAGKWYGRAEHLATMTPSFDFERIDRPALAGECGGAKRPGRAYEAQFDLWDECLGIFNDLGHPWTFWSW
jgi:hypothetical protein